jgi:hypothetical protein
MRYIVSLLIVLLSNICVGQNIPRYHIESGDTIGVILSIQQAQKIYNQQVLLEAYQSYKYGCDSLVKKFYQISNKYEQSQLYNKTLNDQYQKMIERKESENLRLNDKVANLMVDVNKCDLQNQFNQEKSQSYQKIIDDLNSKNKYLFGGAVGFGAIALFLLGMVSSK